MRINRFYIDELGSPNPSSLSKNFYIVTGVIMPDGLKIGAKIFAEHIKFKYWGDRQDYSSIIFHSTEIGARSGPFRIFRDDNRLFDDFIFNLLKLMRASGIVVIANIINLAESANKNLTSEDILKRASRHIISNYVIYLLASRSKGSIIVESASRIQNIHYLEAFERCLTPGGIKGVSHNLIKDLLGSISFVTKENNDIEEQIADLFTYAVKCKYEAELGTKEFDPSSYEGRLLKILNSKLFKSPDNTTPSKQKLYSQIESFKVLV